jgi:anti-sigma factor RsiW
MNANACTEIGSRLGRWYDGELVGDEANAVEEHLRLCPSCADRLDELRGIDRMLDLALPDYRLERPQELIGGERAAGWWLSTAAAAAIPLVLGAAVGSLLYNGHAEPQPIESTTASLIEDSFGPGSLRGIDDLARDLEPEEGGER